MPRASGRAPLSASLQNLGMDFEAQHKTGSRLTSAHRIIDDDPRVKDKYVFIHDIGKEGCFVLTLTRGGSLRHIPLTVLRVQIAVAQDPCHDVPFEQNLIEPVTTVITVPLAGSFLDSPLLNVPCRWFGDLNAKYVRIVFIVTLAPTKDLLDVISFSDEIFTRVQHPKKRPIRWVLRECVTKWKLIPPEVRMVIKCIPACGKKGLKTVGAIMGLPSSLRSYREVD